jgi:hypothetical protein
LFFDKDVGHIQHQNTALQRDWKTGFEPYIGCALGKLFSPLFKKFVPGLFKKVLHQNLPNILKKLSPLKARIILTQIIHKNYPHIHRYGNKLCGKK